MSHRRPGALRESAWLSLACGLPAAIPFYVLLLRAQVPLPIADDYHAVLTFANGLARASGVGAKLHYLLLFQHNEYKLIFEEGVFWLQLALLNHIDFRWLVMLGDGFVAVLFLLLMGMFRLPEGLGAMRMVLLAPVSLLLFQLQYATTLDWAMGSLQNLPVLAFSLLSFVALSWRSSRGVAVGCVALVGAIAASGNGVVAGLVGTLMLMAGRRWKALGAWMAVFAAAELVYFHGYVVRSPEITAEAAQAGWLAHLAPVFAFSFLGATVGQRSSVVLSTCLGVVICGVFAVALRRRYDLENAAIFYSLLFVLATAAGVSVTRSRLGVVESLASRYRVYSSLAIILCYMFLTESYFARAAASSRRMVWGAVALGSVVFCGVSDRAGYALLQGRRQAVVYEMAEFLRGGSGASVPAVGLDPVIARHIAAGLYRPDAAVLAESERLGIYRVPQAAAGTGR